MIVGSVPDGGARDWPAPAAPARSGPIDKTSMWFEVLGPVTAIRGGVELELGAPQQRAVLALLLVRAGATVSLAEIVDTVWGEDPPGTAVNAVHRSVGLLRRALEPELANRETGRWLLRSGSGYRLASDAETADLPRFRLLVAQARTAGEPARALELMEAALGLWRGPVASGIDPVVRAQPVFVGVEREYFEASQEAADLALAAGVPHRVLTAVRAAAQRGPFDEPLQAGLVRLLGAAGHQVEALDVYEQVRRRLADELGIDPGPVLRAAHDAVLNPGPSDPVAGRAAAPAPPAQLPPDLAAFTGRQAELAQALALYSDQAPASETVVITAIGGMAGIGKTALAVHWAHRVAGGFPDGQLYLNLRGFDAADQVVDPGEALSTLLAGLGVRGEQVPAGLDVQSALFRSRVAGRRMLILLDNARDADQVRPLLPGTAGCLVIVTSRNQLAGLVAVEGAHVVTVDLLSAADGMEFLRRRLGGGRVDAEPEAAAEIVALCGGLPLALAIVAARAATRRGFPLAAVAADVRAAHGGLDAFAGPDAAINARSVFSWSYHALSPAAARLFRLLGLPTGPDISAPAAASLAGISLVEVRALLAELTTVHLVAEPAPGRYRSHDLLRAYAAELSAMDEGTGRPALHRLLDHYVHTAHAGSSLISTMRAPISLFPVTDGTTPEVLADPPAVLAWFEAEQANLVAAISLAAEHRFDHHSWRLQWALNPYLRRRASPQVSIATLHVALEAVVRLGDRPIQARILNGLGQAYSRAGKHDVAAAWLAESLALTAEFGDRAYQTSILFSLYALAEQSGAFHEALLHAEELLRIATELGDMDVISGALGALGSAYLNLGEPHQAIAYIERSLEAARELADLTTETTALMNLGVAHYQLGDYPQAESMLFTSLEGARRMGNSWLDSVITEALGDVLSARGDIAGARATWQRALHIAGDTYPPFTAALTRKLEATGSPRD